MFSDPLFMMLHKQNLDQYLLNCIPILRCNPAHKLQPMIVQVISGDIIGDGDTNFICKFKKPAKKGSVIRLVQWYMELQNYLIIIEDYQYLGGEGYAIIKNGKPWDIQKIKLIGASGVITNNFVVLYAPPGHGNAMNTIEINSNTETIQNMNNIEEILCHKLKINNERVYAPYFSLNRITRSRKQPQTQKKNHNHKLFDKNYEEAENSSGIKQIQMLNKIQKIFKNVGSSSKSNEQQEGLQRDVDGIWQTHSRQEKNDRSQQSQRSLVFTQLDLQKVKRMKISGQSPYQQIKPSLTYLNYFISSKSTSIQSLTKQNGQNQAKKSIKQTNDEKKLQKNTQVASDSLNRNLVFNQEEILKLLGKQ